MEEGDDIDYSPLQENAANRAVTARQSAPPKVPFSRSQQLQSRGALQSNKQDKQKDRQLNSEQDGSNESGSDAGEDHTGCVIFIEAPN